MGLDPIPISKPDSVLIVDMQKELDNQRTILKLQEQDLETYQQDNLSEKLHESLHSFHLLKL